MKNDILSVISGIVLLGGGIALLIISLFFWVAIFYALIAIILGIWILMTLKEQESIEQIKKNINEKKQKGR